ncbi:hypothetical protein U1Q18_049354 [Sarracenia purpurea var. burkii]
MTMSNKFLVLGSINTDEVLSSAEGSGNRSRSSSDREGLSPERLNRALLGALNVHSSLREKLKDKSLDKDSAQSVCSEMNSLEGDIQRVRRSPKFNSAQLLALEARIQILKGLDPVKLDMQTNNAVKKEDNEQRRHIWVEIPLVKIEPHSDKGSEESIASTPAIKVAVKGFEVSNEEDT